jgi:hypothetical protein
MGLKINDLPMTSPITKLTVPLKLGDDSINAIVHQKALAGLTMLNVHDDEDTAVEAGLTNVRQHGGRVIEFVHTGERLIVFNVGGAKYTFDPNRIFSDAGIKATLEKHSTWTPAAHAAIKAFAAEYMERFALDREPAIIALHNATKGTFSILSFLPDGQHGAASAHTYVSPRRDKFDFFFVTEQRFFDYLKARDFNVTVQDNQHTPDDGSLSIYFARKGIPYVNIEAEVHNLPSQIEMVQVTREMFEKFIGNNRAS